ncbi:uncharacterized protein [Globicephala melas]|uniref:uncharacterized protein isoform X1 n=2 Tax=Globicephala melas TaxID=9731 RepID=UPI00293D96F6|nr:uncharacterized protein LOC115866657 isoform X1 [Globicephala melas]
MMLLTEDPGTEEDVFLYGVNGNGEKQDTARRKYLQTRKRALTRHLDLGLPSLQNCLSWDLRFCISNKLPGEMDAVWPGTTLQEQAFKMHLRLQLLAVRRTIPPAFKQLWPQKPHQFEIKRSSHSSWYIPITTEQGSANYRPVPSEARSSAENEKNKEESSLRRLPPPRCLPGSPKVKLITQSLLLPTYLCLVYVPSITAHFMCITV